ncbi:hypothetical protein JAAARDRAFT_197907 [Jaapia argillacea MUCL 33604]|uniref:Uncharacterized protein n=1 Tax=Jaapia argillacea MUCL 33604 TaxID=933084 RepID=A0A067PDH1_9AGAM|nr:hypothetical protein JAAARDRAFT_197907 [Jaapia argillacea MUCL 33604]
MAHGRLQHTGQISHADQPSALLSQRSNTTRSFISTASRGSDRAQAGSVKVTINDDTTSAEPRLYAGQLHKRLTPQDRSSAIFFFYFFEWKFNLPFLETQTQQDYDDKAAKKKAMKELVQPWMDRLRLISLITMFFASVQSTFIGSAKSDDPTKASVSLKVVEASLMGALVMHAAVFTSACTVVCLGGSVVVFIRVEQSQIVPSP